MKTMKSRASRALGHVFGQRRRYAVVGVLTHRGPMTVGGIAILVRTPAFIVRSDLGKLQRSGVVQVIDTDEPKPRYLLAHHYAGQEVQALRGAVAARDEMLAESDRELGQCSADYRRANDDRFTMLDLIREFVDIDGRECEPGQWECGTHAYPTGETGETCPYTQARDMLAAHEPEIEARRKARAAETSGQIQNAMKIFGSGK
jgi:hypothetical protein